MLPPNRYVGQKRRILALLHLEIIQKLQEISKIQPTDIYHDICCTLLPNLAGVRCEKSEIHVPVSKIFDQK